MEFKSKYISKKPDLHGRVAYTASENEVWKILYERQIKIIQHRACDEFIAGVQKLHLNKKEIPQLPEVSTHLRALTGWEVAPVTALISAHDFFTLLAHRKFPAATFIRTLTDLDYVQEPDVFHELFGHCPLLTVPLFADFVHTYAELVLSLPQEDWALLQRLFWFTVEFGLIQTKKGLRIYGGGILSSFAETPYSLESCLPQRQWFNPWVALRTPYRIDQLQPVYFVIEHYEQLYRFAQSDVRGCLEKVRSLGEFPPLFEVDPNNPSIHIHAC